jgi:hypothetical protein
MEVLSFLVSFVVVFLAECLARSWMYFLSTMGTTAKTSRPEYRPNGNGRTCCNNMDANRKLNPYNTSTLVCNIYLVIAVYFKF